MLSPFVGLILCDIGFIIQTKFMETSVNFFVLNQFVFGLFGGYSSIYANMFAKAMASCQTGDEKSKLMGLFEGLMGLGGTIGFVTAGPLLRALGYFRVFVLVLILHLICFIIIVVFVREKPQHKNSKNVENGGTDKGMCHRFTQHFYQAFVTVYKERPEKRKLLILVLLLSFAISYFVLFGSLDIMFYYLKHRFQWTAATYGYLSGSIYGLGTIMTLFVYRFLNHMQVADTALALIGLVSRLLGRAFLAVTWSTWSTFLLIPIDIFCKFGSAGLRSLISQQVDKDEQGQIFSVVSLLEAVCYLLSSVSFNALFPATLSFFPQLSFILMALLMVIPVLFISSLHVFQKRQLNVENSKELWRD